jgi:hypothetical protein
LIERQHWRSSTKVLSQSSIAGCWPPPYYFISIVMLARCLSLCFPRPSGFEPILGGYRVIDANGLALVHLYGQPPNGIVLSDPWFIDSSKKRTSQVCAAYEAPSGELKVCLFKVTNISPSRATTRSPEPLTQVGLINSYPQKPSIQNSGSYRLLRRSRPLGVGCSITVRLNRACGRRDPCRRIDATHRSLLPAILGESLGLSFPGKDWVRSR